MSRRFCTSDGVEGLGRLAMMVAGTMAALLALPSTPARAADNTYSQEGVTLRLVALAPDAAGHIRGALSVQLEPGWKTYWIAPGPVGLAPRLDFSASSGLAGPAVSFPVPVRFTEGDTQSVGYAEPVAFAIRAEADGASPTLRVSAFLGVCRELCVPVQATLEATPSASLSNRALVTRAEAAVPPDKGPLSVTSARWKDDGSALLVEAPSASGGAGIDAFASAGDGWSFGAPVARVEDGKPVLSLPIVSLPSATADLRSVDLLLTAGERAQLSRAVPVAPR